MLSRVIRMSRRSPALLEAGSAGERRDILITLLSIDGAFGPDDRPSLQ